MSHVFTTFLAASLLVGIGSAHAGQVCNGLNFNGIRTTGLLLDARASDGKKPQTQGLGGMALDQVSLR